MKKPRNYQWTEKFLLVLIFCSACFLLLGNLGNQYLWQDEAQTALVSKTILEHGVPRGYDGKNFFSQELEAEYGEDYIWKWHPWLSFYVLAAFFKVFGIGTFVARLPFALFGIATVFLTYAFCKRLWQSRAVAAVAALLLLTSVPFLLLSRQCRYYSLVSFFCLLSLYAYIRLLEGGKLAPVTLFFSSSLVFHANYMYFVPLIAAVILHSLLFHRRRLRAVLLILGLVVLINIPWIVWFATMRYGPSYGARMFSTERLILFTKVYLVKIGLYMLPPYLLLIALLAVVGNRVATGHFVSRSRIFWQKLLLLLFFVFFSIIVVIFTSSGPFLRFLAPLIPIFEILIAFLIVAVARFHIVFSIAAIAILVFTSSIADFLYEITHDYDGPIEGIVNYLNENASDDDVVAITYGDMPLKFYTNMRIVGGLTGQELSPARQAEWVVLRKYTICEKDAAVRQYLRQNVPWHNYEKIEIDYPDIPFENREEPDQHNFKTVTDAEKVFMFRKIR